MKAKGYEIEHLPLKLNIVGVRNSDTTPNTFNDEIHCITRKPNSRDWYHWVWPVTTDPGTYWLRNPMQPQGTAILQAGQYLRAYKIGRHQGVYEALCQRLGEVRIIRDYDRDAILDWNNGRIEQGFLGINIHHASIHGTTRTVDRYSAGCQVFANINDFRAFMELCKASSSLHGNSFSYTLIDQRAMQRQARRSRAINGLKVAGGILLLSGLVSAYRTNIQNHK